MEDRQTAEFCVGLDFSEEEQRNSVHRLLEFAEIPMVADVQDASVVFGDGSNASRHTTYVYLQSTAASGRSTATTGRSAAIGSRSTATGTRSAAMPGGDRIVAELKINSVLAAFAQAQSIAEQNLHYPHSSDVFASYVGTSDAAISTRQLMAACASKDVTVLITGESGTGKEVVARALHQGSRRSSGPFVPVNCGAIPSELLESELFGHEKGAFTGAITQKTGRFELAHGGTLFLDEIGDLPFVMQVKVLRAIEQKSFERVGGVNTRVSDVRIVAATNKDLESRIVTGEFREDLFYRLNVFPIELAPLRERGEDMPLLVNALVARIHEEQGLQVRLSVDTLDVLSRYAWPGNVRELGNLLQRLAIQYPNGLVRSTDLPKKYSEDVSIVEAGLHSGQSNTSTELSEVLLPINGIDLKDYLTRLEKSLIEQALEDTNAVVARAADRLHIRRTTLVEKMRKHGLGRSGDSLQ